MAVRKLFVSHSSKTPADVARLKDVCISLKQRGFHLLVDKNAEFGDKEAEIYPGSDWDLRINEWMAECHAAVILFNSTALEKSDWVHKEAAVLSWRRELEDNFTLIPILLDGITAEDLQQGLYGVLRITKGQCISASNDAATIVQRIEDGLGPPETAANTPFERLEQVLRKILQEQADAETLGDVWQTLDGTDKPPWQPNQRARFADALARLLLRDSTRVLDQLQKLIDRIRPRVKQDRANELLQSLACLWVDERAAAGLAGAHNYTHLVALNGNFLDMFTAERYMERAWPLSDLRHFVSVDQQAGRSSQGIQKAIRDQFRFQGAPDNDEMNSLLDQQIKAFTEPVVVLVVLACDNAGQPQFPDAALLSDVHQLFPNLIFLFGTGPAPPRWLPETIRLLDPPLDTKLEFKMQFSLNNTRQFLNRLYGAPG